jgi:polyhydroxybutyrate depolymerase
MKFSSYLNVTCLLFVIFLCVVSFAYTQQNLRAWHTQGKRPAEVSPLTTENTGTLHQDGEINWDGKLRIYYYYEPSDPGPSPRPLVILLHGGAININKLLGMESEDQKAPSKLWLEIADEEKFYLAIPQGHQDHWNDCRGDCDHNGDEDDVGFIDAMINEIQSRYSIDNKRIYSTGISNGGLMSYRLAVELSDRIAAIAVIAAALPANNICSEPVNPISVMIMNGTDDTWIPWEGGQSSKEGVGTFLSAYESVHFWVNFNNCDTIPEYFDFPDLTTADRSTVSREIYNNGVQNTEVILYRIDGGGHVEPSIEEQYADWYLTLFGFGSQNHDVEMSREVWDFLKQQTLSGNTSVNNSSDDLSVNTFHLSQNYPNPFNPETVIEYQLPRAADVEISIFNLQGQKIATLVQDYRTAGSHKIIWDGKDKSGQQVASGVYLYQLKTGKFMEMKKMMLLR